MITAQAPVFSPLSTWYNSSRPSRLLHRLSCSAISSSPTAPVNKTDLGGSTYLQPKKVNARLSLLNHDSSTYCSTSSSVLSSAASKVGYLILVNQFIVSCEIYEINFGFKNEKVLLIHCKMLHFSQDSIISFQVVFLE